eukprot:TRINITY_DN2283_c0_g1_i1.p1 TRINITY_DN2283_c0_g1~~TRINITY_DN2283_c0_g1_i1.p1  ORF type:complete len:177 (+),score=31.09 TRINITY_DN2283_c0_g1_i1:71-532(+)
MLNTNGGGILFGIADDGSIVGQKCMSKPKRDYIVREITERLNDFQPCVPSDYYNVKFKELVDVDGYGVIDMYVVVVEAVVLYSGRQQFVTSRGHYYKRKMISVGGHARSQITRAGIPTRGRVRKSKRYRTAGYTAKGVRNRAWQYQTDQAWRR